MNPTSSLLVDLLSGLFVEAGAIDHDLVPEAAVARAVGTTTVRLRRLRAAGLVAAERVGRGYIYRRADARNAAAAAALVELGADVADVAALFARDFTERGAVAEAVDGLLARVADRLGRDLGRARVFQDLLDRHARSDFGDVPGASDVAA